MHVSCIENVLVCVSDLNECSAKPGVCQNGRCENTVGSYRCRCDQGFSPSTTQTDCIGKHSSTYLSVSLSLSFHLCSCLSHTYLLSFSHSTSLLFCLVLCRSLSLTLPDQEGHSVGCISASHELWPLHLSFSQPPWLDRHSCYQKGFPPYWADRK